MAPNPNEELKLINERIGPVINTFAESKGWWSAESVSQWSVG